MLTYSEVLSWCVKNRATITFTNKPQILAGVPAQVQVEMRIPSEGVAKVATCPLEREFEPHQALVRAVIACVYVFIDDQSKLIIEPASDMLGSKLLH